jgi:hypothetical protein
LSNDNNDKRNSNSNDNDGDDDNFNNNDHSNSNGIQPLVSSIAITSTASSSYKYKRRRVDAFDDEDDNSNDTDGGKSTVRKASSSNHQRLCGHDSLHSIGNQAGSSSKGKVTFGSVQVVTSNDDFILTWTEGVTFCNFKFRAPGYGEIENNFALSSAPSSTLSKDSNNFVFVEACQV